MPALSLFSRCSRHLALLALLTSFANVHAQEAPQMDLPRVELTAGMYRIDAQLAQTPGQRQLVGSIIDIGKSLGKALHPLSVLALV